MFDPIDFDPALAGSWPPGSAKPLLYGAGPDPELDAAVEVIRLETKAASEPSPTEELQQLLNDMTGEMRLQFEAFRKIRADAEAKLATGDDNEQKIAKADIKSASDALSLLVRTIEKIDSLQRSLAHDREAAIEQAFDEAAYNQLLEQTEREIERRVEERVVARLASGGDAGPAQSTGPPGAL